jgi:formylglycine-generating enzyme required for sulfatase activity
MKRIQRWILPLVLLAGAVAAQAAEPVCTIREVKQRPGTQLVDITYDLAADPGAQVAISPQYSVDGGASWSNTAISVTETAGAYKHLTWNAGADWPDGYTAQARIKLCATAGGGMPGDYLVIDLSAGPSASSYPVSYLTAVPAGGWTDEHKTSKLVMRRIPAGTFTMGSPPGELGRYSNKEDQRQVTLTKDYYIGVFQVTQKQWERVMGNWPSYFANTVYRDSRPVERVSYLEIRENPLPETDYYNKGSAISPNWPQSSQVHVNSFMGKLRAKTGLTTLDLPTEAQWEYACRAGTTTALNSGKNLTNTESCPNMSEVGRYRHNHPGGYSSSSSVSTAGGTAKVGSYLSNAWGLYDMHGNVWEWCLDWYETYHAATTDPVGAASGSSRVGRGGGWFNDANRCRSAVRYFLYPSVRSGGIGFRLSRTLP